MEVEIAKPDKKQDLTPRLIDLVSPIGKGQDPLLSTKSWKNNDFTKYS